MNEEKTLPEKVLEYLEKQELFSTPEGQIYMQVKVVNRYESLIVGTRPFSNYLLKVGLEFQKKPLRRDQIEQISNVLESHAMFSKIPTVELSNRIAQRNGSIYVDLCDDMGTIIKISKSGIKKGTSKVVPFKRTNRMLTQFEPDTSVDITEYIGLIKKHFNLNRNTDALLYSIYLCTCFIPDISAPIACIVGSKGAGKSTFLSKQTMLVDPNKTPLKTLPRSEHDLAIVLNNNYMSVFDNLERLTDEKSNMLSMACTGGGVEVRKLYHDTETVVLNIKRKVAINGIDDIITKADLNDRSLIFRLKRISSNRRKTDEEVFSSLEADIPKILGCIFKIISNAMKLYSSIELKKQSRMADFTKWSFTIAEVLEIGGQNFIEAYEENKKQSSKELLLENPLIQALLILMNDEKVVQCSVSELLNKLKVVARREGIDTSVKIFPKQPNVLSRRLNEFESNLKNEDIEFDINNTGPYKVIRLVNKKNYGK